MRSRDLTFRFRNILLQRCQRTDRRVHRDSGIRFQFIEFRVTQEIAQAPHLGPGQG